MPLLELKPYIITEINQVYTCLGYSIFQKSHGWYVMSSLGIFDVKGLTGQTPTFQFGSPIFDKVEIKVDNDNNKPLIIQTIDNGLPNIYVEKIERNGSSYNRLSIPYKDLVQGDTLKFYMSEKPNKNLFGL